MNEGPINYEDGVNYAADKAADSAAVPPQTTDPVVEAEKTPALTIYWS